MVSYIFLLLSIGVAPTSAESGHFDCAVSNWSSDWKPAQAKYCCLEEGVCNPQKVSSDQAPHNCMKGLHEWQKSWSSAKMEWCCTDVGLGCSDDVKVPPSPSSASRWISYGDAKACRIDRNDHSVTGDGEGTVEYKGYPFDQTLQECKLYCESTWATGRPTWMGKAPAKCLGIEWADGHCEVWTHQIGYSAPAVGFQCLHYSPFPVILQGPDDQKVFVVEADGSVKAARFTARAQDVFHKITNDDKTVSFLSTNGKFLTANEDGTVIQSSGALGDWEKFTETSHGDSLYSYRSFHKKYLIVLVDDGSVRATASHDNVRTKLLVNPIHSATATISAASLSKPSAMYAMLEPPSWRRHLNFNALTLGFSAALVASLSVGLFRATRGQIADGGNRALGLVRGEVAPNNRIREVETALGEVEQPLYSEGS